MVRYVIYRRVSRQEQAKSGLGLEAQSRDVKLYIEHYSGKPYEVIADLVEVASGAENERPILDQAVQLAMKEGATLLVSKLDRLSRRVSKVAQLMEMKNLKFKVASMPHADKFQLHLYAALAEQEREFISIRTKQALESAKARGVKLGGLRQSTIRINAARKVRANEFVGKIHNRVIPMIESGLNNAQIARELNASGVKASKGGQWHNQTVKRLRERLNGLEIHQQINQK